MMDILLQNLEKLELTHLYDFIFPELFNIIVRRFF